MFSPRGSDVGHKTARTVEVSCGEVVTSQHCRVSGQSLPNSSNMIRWSGWRSPLWGEFSSDAQQMPFRKDGDCMGDEGKAVGIAQSPGGFAVNCLITSPRTCPRCPSRNPLRLIRPPQSSAFSVCGNGHRMALN